MTDPKRTKITLNVSDFAMSQQQPGRIMWPDGTEISAEQFNNSVTIATEAYAIGRKDSLRRALAAIVDRRRTFSSYDADQQYLAALDDAYGLVNNLFKDAERESP